jgi:hypothetical protein
MLAAPRSLRGFCCTATEEHSCDALSQSCQNQDRNLQSFLYESLSDPKAKNSVIASDSAVLTMTSLWHGKCIRSIGPASPNKSGKLRADNGSE